MYWDQNLEWKELSTLEVGDIANLRATDVFQYFFKVKITSIDNDLIAGIVEAIFDCNSGAEICGGDIAQYVGKPISFSKTNIQDIIKKK